VFPNIDAERARRGWTRVELARQIGVSYSTLKNWMRGSSDIPANKLIEMSELFDCSVDYLLGIGKPSN